MLISVLISMMVSLAASAPGYDLHGLGLSLHEASLFAPPVLPAPIIKAAPIIAPAPVLEPAPLFKAFAPLAPVAPVIKAVAPAATSYATVTQFHIAHPSPAIVKTIVAPQPILKSFIPAPIAFGHAYH